MIWIDSPVGTGFSYVKGDDYASDEKSIANDLYTALQSILFTLNPQYAANPFFIFGESYGGKYVPWLASTILANNGKPRSGKKINLKGIGLGNGWVEPYFQTGSYAPYLYANERINVVELEGANTVYQSYKAAIDMKLYDVAMVIGNDLLNGLMVAAGVNDVYDIRKTSDPTTPFANRLTTFLNTGAARKSLNVTSNVQWGLCDTNPYFALMSDIDRSAETLVPAILAQIPILLYNGNYDLICNMEGTATWSDAMDWPGSSAFASATNQTWNGAGQVGGYFKSAQGLTRLIVYNAGHMSPFDQPANVQVMVWRFLTGGFSQVPKQSARKPFKVVN
jgi:carboxypeptidase C (cathepsin A)